MYALDGDRLTPDVLSDRLVEIRRALSGVPVVSVNSWASLSGSDPAARAVQERRVVSAMESAAELACPLVKAFGGEIPPGVEVERVVSEVAEAVQRLGIHGRRLGVRLAVETHDGFSRGETLRAMLDKVDETEYVGALWDVHHPYRHGESVERTADLIGDRVLHAHVKDAVRDGDGWEYRRLGEGELPVQPMLRALSERGFDGYVSVDWEKMWHPEIEGPDTVLPQYAQALRGQLARLSTPRA